MSEKTSSSVPVHHLSNITEYIYPFSVKPFISTKQFKIEGYKYFDLLRMGDLCPYSSVQYQYNLVTPIKPICQSGLVGSICGLTVAGHEKVDNVWWMPWLWNLPRITSMRKAGTCVTVGGNADPFWVDEWCKGPAGKCVECPLPFAKGWETMTATTKVGKEDQSTLSYLISLFTGEWVRREVTRTSKKNSNLSIQSRKVVIAGLIMMITLLHCTFSI